VEMEAPMSTITQTVRNDPIFQILFVLHPTTHIISIATAMNDLAFVNITFTVLHHDGDIHNIKCTRCNMLFACKNRLVYFKGVWNISAKEYPSIPGLCCYVNAPLLV
jgi:hypothetical protein